jgi:hypothetical protein
VPLRGQVSFADTTATTGVPGPLNRGGTPREGVAPGAVAGTTTTCVEHRGLPSPGDALVVDLAPEVSSCPPGSEPWLVTKRGAER